MLAGVLLYQKTKSFSTLLRHSQSFSTRRISIINKSIVHQRHVVRSESRRQGKTQKQLFSTARSHNGNAILAGEQRCVVPILCLFNTYTAGYNYGNQKSQCEQLTLNKMNNGNETTLPKNISTLSQLNNAARKIKKLLRVLGRFIRIMINLTPILAIYSLDCMLSNGAESTKNTAGGKSSDSVMAIRNLYLRFCLRCVESSGAAVVKLMQWASSRPDLFGEPFCSVFCQLQDNAIPHSWTHTEKVMMEAYGDDWKDKICLEQIVGSGCIGQVYKGTVLDNDGVSRDVAVKVIHPNVKETIDLDLDLLRMTAAAIENFPFQCTASLRWLNLSGFADEFGSMLRSQLDFRTEARNLDQFSANFATNPDVIFPEVLKGFDPHPDVLIETYCEGIPVLTFAKENASNAEVRRKLSTLGIHTVCQMIFKDNFIHGDLHPGNILISPKDHKLILLDAGIVKEYVDADHDLIVSILTSFIRMDGSRAGKLMLSDSDMRTSAEHQSAVDADTFVKKIEHLTDLANSDDYFMEHLGSYISYICDAASTHHVMMNQSFISIALAVKVQEGVALSLDPCVKVMQVANPVILEAELRRKMERNVSGIAEKLRLFFSPSKVIKE